MCAFTYSYRASVSGEEFPVNIEAGPSLQHLKRAQTVVGKELVELRATVEEHCQHAKQLQEGGHVL